MKITKIKYQRVKNLGNYETERVELVALIDKDEHPKEVFFELRDLIFQLLELEEEDDYAS